ncbi:MAG TPA: T9SS type A sorting domain-containing protein [Prolixibacteraceae bacterium]|nr:T9SS type A sorting domain-containing protein [Prolixibacteraceae bacterium]
MKNVYVLLLSLVISLGINSTYAQSISASGTVFLPQDSIGFTYSKPSFTSTDWIGIYKTDQTPGEATPSITWKYIKAESGILYLAAPDEPGSYKAILLCCDGYDVVATSAEFNVVAPSFETSFPVYVAGDSIVFNYTSPKFSATDKIAIYESGVKPGQGVQPLDWKYIPGASGTISFKTTLTVGRYDAYLLCCDGNDTIAGTSFEVMAKDAAFLVYKKLEIDAGSPVEFTFNDPSFAAGDWIAIYADGEIPGNNYITYGQVVSKSGTVSFPGVLNAGAYFAVLFCCNSTATEYARTDAFVVRPQTGGSYVKASTSVYPFGTPIFVNYKDENFAATDWIGIYKKGVNPGSAEPALKMTAPKDSSTVEFAELPMGDYVIYLFCCNGTNIKAKSEFKVVGLNTPSIVSSAFSFGLNEPIEFIYNDPNFESGQGTDWIGVYHPDDIPANVRSMLWSYHTKANGTVSYSVPYELGTWTEENPNTPLAPGDYVAYLFCCDAYTVYATTSFTITQFPTGTSASLKTGDIINLFPNPTTGLVNIRLAEGRKIQKITIYNLIGQVKYEESISGAVNEKVLNMKLNKGIYFLEVMSGNQKSSKKLIIQ